jgi:hypothetical protein
MFGGLWPHIVKKVMAKIPVSQLDSDFQFETNA